MKRIEKGLYALFSIFISPLVLSCPTCVGRIKPESPTFFHAEFYKPGQSVSRETPEQFGHNQLKKLIDDNRRKK